MLPILTLTLTLLITIVLIITGLGQQRRALGLRRRWPGAADLAAVRRVPLLYANLCYYDIMLLSICYLMLFCAIVVSVLLLCVMFVFLSL